MLFNESKKKEYCEWINGFSDDLLYKQVRVIERILQTPLMNDCVLLDDLIEVHELFRDECVCRIGRNACIPKS